jgi:hypothetical protein
MNYADTYKVDPYLIRTLMKNLLKEGQVKVTFKKVNGEIRNMLCTTNSEMIPEVLTESKVPKIVRKENEDVCRVFDVDKQEWRSFRYENIIEVEQK